MANRIPSKSLEGRRVRLLACTDTRTKLARGATGTVAMVDDVGTMHVNWDNGSVLGLCWDAGDRWEVIARS